MRVTPALFLLILTVVYAERSIPLAAQQLPADARPWQLVRTIVQQTGGHSNDVDRQAFRTRLTGEAAEIDVEDLKGTWPSYADVNIDTIIALPSRFRYVPANPEAKQSARTDTIERSLIYATVYSSGVLDNWYFFCERDSIWRIESWRQFPSAAQRMQIIEQANNDDTSTIGSFVNRLHLSRLLLNDADLSKVFKEIIDDTEKIIPQLRQSTSWQRLVLAKIMFDSIGEYDALDDDLDPGERLFYRLNQAALQRLQGFGIQQISRTSGEKEMILLELPSIPGYSTGFAYASTPANLPYPTKDEFFALKPINANWWLFKRKAIDTGQTVQSIEPEPGDSEPKSGKASHLVPKEKES